MYIHILSTDQHHVSPQANYLYIIYMTYLAQNTEPKTRNLNYDKTVSDKNIEIWCVKLQSISDYIYHWIVMETRLTPEKQSESAAPEAGGAVATLTQPGAELQLGGCVQHWVSQQPQQPQPAPTKRSGAI